MVRLPPEVISFRSVALENCATVSMLRQVENMPNRQSGAQFCGYIHSRDGFSTDYLDYNGNGNLIIKSDPFQVLKHNGEQWYRAVNKHLYLHHHVTKPLEMQERINSMCLIEVPDKVYKGP